MVCETEINYVIWQNRSFRFYLASRLLYANELYSPSAFCSIQAIETLMKATLVYWDRSFNPESMNHKIVGMINSIRNKVDKGKEFDCPKYFYMDKRFQSVTRYPDKNKGVMVPCTFLSDLDEMFCQLIEYVPFQFNTELSRTLLGKKKKNFDILKENNSQMERLNQIFGLKSGG